MPLNLFANLDSGSSAAPMPGSSRSSRSHPRSTRTTSSIRAIRSARPMADLDDEVDPLYGLPLAEFVTERDALAKRLRADGRREDANAVKALRKPSVAAWAANQVLRSQPGQRDALLEAGDALRAAGRRTCWPGAATPPRRGRRARRSGARWAASSPPRAGWRARAGSRRPPCSTACVRRCMPPLPTTRRGPKWRRRGVRPRAPAGGVCRARGLCGGAGAGQAREAQGQGAHEEGKGGRRRRRRARARGAAPGRRA